MQINNTWGLFPNFTSGEFACNGIGGDFICQDVVWILQAVRNKYGKCTVSSGYRTPEKNSSLSGSSTTSDHLTGYAADFYVDKCSTLEGRKEVIKYMKDLPGFKFAYGDGYKLTVDGVESYPSTPNMGHFIHLSVK